VFFSLQLLTTVGVHPLLLMALLLRSFSSAEIARIGIALPMLLFGRQCLSVCTTPTVSENIELQLSMADADADVGAAVGWHNAAAVVNTEILLLSIPMIVFIGCWSYPEKGKCKHPQYSPLRDYAKWPIQHLFDCAHHQ
jgi:hypothetical protein